MELTMTQHRSYVKRTKRKDIKKTKRNLANSHLSLINAAPTPLIQDFQIHRNNAPIKPRNITQQRYIQSIEHNQLTFATGPAGTGKTWLCAAKAVEALQSGEVKKIVITRPVVEAEENMGFLPGSIEEKFAPYFTPFREVLEERLGAGHVKALIKAGQIEMAPLAYMRGRSFKACFVVLDEAQNTREGQMKLFLTRIGEGSKVVVNGDISQKDINVESGLTDALTRFADLAQVGHVQFDRSDIVRSGLVQQIVDGYEEKRLDEHTNIAPNFEPFELSEQCA
jgi:phosphate starvation-inducible PhoH-like protein